jgi:23S rRNA pseudouridine955/2504/2580 synthase
MVRVDEEGKPSRSRFSEVERFADATLAEIAIETGRTHQIRVHSAHIGHPVAGDEKYGDKTFNRKMRGFGLKRLFLHAARFEFSIGERSYGFSAPLPTDLKSVLDALGSGAMRSSVSEGSRSHPRRSRESGDPAPSPMPRKKPRR